MSDPYQRANPGDPILADNWNKMQEDVRDHILSHTHAGGADEGTLLTGASIDKRSAIEVQKVNATTSLSVKGIDVEAKLSALDSGKLSVAGGAIAGPLNVAGMASFNADAIVSGNGVIGAMLVVNGPTNLKGALSVSGAATFGAVTVGTVTFGDKSVQSTAASLPRGLIVMWSGQANNIPGGWALCNGQNGTPDLRDRFIAGAGSSYQPGSSGEPDTHVHDVKINAFPMNTDLGGEHDHNLPSGWYMRRMNSYAAVKSDEYSMIDIGGFDDNRVKRVQKTTPHSHTFSFPGADTRTSDAKGQNRPKWYALCYIMKL